MWLCRRGCGGGGVVVVAVDVAVVVAVVVGLGGGWGKGNVVKQSGGGNGVRTEEERPIRWDRWRDGGLGGG